LAGSFFECFAGSRSGRFAMAPIWVESRAGESDRYATSIAAAPEPRAPFCRVGGDQRVGVRSTVGN
jgi:hypothetical protein